MEKKVLALTDATTSNEGAGSFSGYASVWDRIDSQGDIVLRGAYAETIPQFLARGFIGWGHDWNDPVATIREAKEDARGLYIVADFHSDADAQKWRTRTVERIARGKFMGLSIGYETVDAEDTPAARLLKKIKLYETSLVTVPALDVAGVTEAKDSKRAWDAAYINDLPDASFAYIEPGGDKDDEGKTTPRSLRHFPHHDSGGSVDLPHVRNALSRIPQSDVPDAAKSRAEAHCQKHLDAASTSNHSPADAKAFGADAPDASFEALAQAIADAFVAQRGGIAFAVATYPEHAIVCHYPAPNGMASDQSEVYWDVPYVRNADGTVTLGNPTEVDEQITYVPAKGLPLLLAEMKAGARNSATDAERLQQIHDLAVSNGAACPAPESAPKGAPLRDHVGRVLADNRALLGRLRDVASLRAGEGKAPGATYAAALADLDAQQGDITAALKALELPPADPDGSDLWLDFQRITARLNGVAV